jgi:uncharacterized membrane protein
MNTTADSLARLEQHLGRLFAIGLSLSASALVIGLTMFLMVPDAPSRTWFLNAGLVILMATPVLRVIVSIVEYVKMRDWFFVVATIVVLLELSVTMFVALK